MPNRDGGMPPPVPKQPGRRYSFAERRTAFDSRVLRVFLDRHVRRTVREQSKINLDALWRYAARKLEKPSLAGGEMLDPLQVHDKIVGGLPGEALYVSSAMLFDSMSDALALFGVTSKTAKQRIGGRLSSGEGEIALRIGRVLAMASDVFGAVDAARAYLRLPNFALGGAAPCDLLKTAEGERLVLSELSTQAEGGPV